MPLSLSPAPYNALLAVYAVSKVLDERGEEILEEMRTKGLEWDSYTYTALMMGRGDRQEVSGTVWCVCAWSILQCCAIWNSKQCGVALCNLLWDWSYYYSLFTSITNTIYDMTNSAPLPRTIRWSGCGTRWCSKGYYPHRQQQQSCSR